jgi:5'-nucleotidase
MASDRLKILLTNDDGIFADGIYAAYQELRKVGDVIVVAPDTERSSVGHGITLAHPIRYKKIRRKNKFFGYGITGTPADCVKFALSVLLKQKPDLVVSGINLGQNDGCSVFYSGTVAGAREGALLGISAMAVSLATYANADFTVAAQWTAKIAKWLVTHPLSKRTFLSVNVPHRPKSKIKGWRFTQQGTMPIHGSFQKRLDPNLGEYYWMTGKLPMNKRNNDIDTYALQNQYVTITPIHSDSTDYSALTTMRNGDVPW